MTTTTTATTTTMVPTTACDAVVTKHQSSVSVSITDLELRLLQAFGQFATDKLIGSYLYAKNSSRIVGFLAATTEKVVTKTGLVALVGFFFAQYQRLGHPLVQAVDEAMGRRIIQAFVGLLLLAEQQETQENNQNQLENGVGDAALKLTYQERLQAMLQGQVPRLEAMLRELKQREEEQAKEPVVVMDLQDFVPKDEVKRLQAQSHVVIADKEQELKEMKDQLSNVERARQQLEQKLIDVHNYQESERGRRFQDMEEELARTKLEASQKAHDLRKLELVIEGLRKKKQLKTKGSRSNLTPSLASSDTNEEL